VKNPLVFIERNAIPGKIFHVREIAHKIPQCKKGPTGKVRFFAEKEGFLPEKCPKKGLNAQDSSHKNGSN
jgi:hypothetical protein